MISENAMNIDMLIELAKQDSGLTESITLIEDLRLAEFEYDSAIKSLENRQIDYFDNSIKLFADLNPNFNLSGNERFKIIKVGDSEIYITINFENVLNNKNQVNALLIISRLNVDQSFNLCLRSTSQIIDTYDFIDESLRGKFNNSEIISDEEVELMNKYLFSLKAETTNLNSMDDFIFYLTNNEDLLLLGSNRLITIVEAALSDSINLT